MGQEAVKIQTFFQKAIEVQILIVIYINRLQIKPTFGLGLIFLMLEKPKLLQYEVIIYYIWFDRDRDRLTGQGVEFRPFDRSENTTVDSKPYLYPSLIF